jgi:hypothetical protein
LVAFTLSDVFGRSGGANDKVLVDIYDHWLERTA